RRLALVGRAERGGELAAGADLQLAVDAREGHLDGLHRHEERLGDLLVAELAGGQLRDAALARGQRVETADDELAGAGSRRGALLVPPCDERRRTRAVGEIDAFAEEIAGLAAVVPAPERRAQVDER